jgi:hypothetical protein
LLIVLSVVWALTPTTDAASASAASSRAAVAPEFDMTVPP